MDKQFIDKNENVNVTPFVFDKTKHVDFSDIHLVSYLVSKRYKMLHIEKINKGDKSVFYFDRSEAIEQEKLKFFNHDATVDPLAFSETLRNLRSLAKS